MSNSKRGCYKTSCKRKLVFAELFANIRVQLAWQRSFFALSLERRFERRVFCFCPRIKIQRYYLFLFEKQFFLITEHQLSAGKWRFEVEGIIFVSSCVLWVKREQKYSFSSEWICIESDQGVHNIEIQRDHSRIKHLIFTQEKRLIHFCFTPLDMNSKIS